MRAKVNLNNIIAYIVGNLRYRLYYSRYKYLIRKHVREQIDMRIKFMKKECYENGTCIICGCATTALQMSNKQCDAPCYPIMVGKEIWDKFNSEPNPFGLGKISIMEKDRQHMWIMYNKMPVRLKTTTVAELVEDFSEHFNEQNF